MEHDEKQKIYELLKEFSTAMLITHSKESEKKLHARPMAIADISENFEMYFFTSFESSKTKELLDNPEVVITCQSSNCFITVSGESTIIQNQSEIDKHWKESYKVWFPEGKDDPDIALIKVNLRDGEYWDNQGLNKVKYLYKATKAYLTGTTPEINEGEEHGRALI